MKFSLEIVERFARAWASIDGKDTIFDKEKQYIIDVIDWDNVEYTGTYEGYMAEAEELLKRAGCEVSITK